jgi:hypothetical protein
MSQTHRWASHGVGDKCGGIPMDMPIATGAASDPLTFGSKEAAARARCVVAEAEIALVSRDLGWPAKALDAARVTLETHGDRVNAAHARNLAVRRLLLIGRLDEAARALVVQGPRRGAGRFALDAPAPTKRRARWLLDRFVA